MTQTKHTIDWSGYRREFPVTERYIYFNHAAVSPLSTRVREAIDRFSDQLLGEGYLCIEHAFERVGEVRGAAARLLGCDAGEIAFIKNTTQGVLLAANGIRWSAGDNIVMPSIEFPANVYPWLALAERGVEPIMVESDDGRVTAEMLAGACDDRTKAVTVSLVQFSNGYRIELEQLADFCRRRGIFLHVDGIQGIGMVTCDVRKAGIDFLSTGGHKWLLTPPGTGIFYCRGELIEELDIWNPGWTGVADFMNFLEYRPVYRTDASRFEEGAVNLHGIHGLGASLERFLEIGMDRVEHRILRLVDLLEQGLTKRGCTVTSPRREREKSGIICFSVPGEPAERLMDRLAKAGVVASLREGAIRLSPHFYNNEEEVERFLELLE